MAGRLGCGAGADQEEFLAAEEMRVRVGRASDGGEVFAEGGEDLVAGLVAEGIVDGLEVVEVEDEYGIAGLEGVDAGLRGAAVCEAGGRALWWRRRLNSIDDAEPFEAGADVLAVKAGGIEAEAVGLVHDHGQGAQAAGLTVYVDAKLVAGGLIARSSCSGPSSIVWSAVSKRVSSTTEHGDRRRDDDRLGLGGRERALQSARARHERLEGGAPVGIEASEEQGTAVRPRYEFAENGGGGDGNHNALPRGRTVTARGEQPAERATGEDGDDRGGARRGWVDRPTR